MNAFAWVLLVVSLGLGSIALSACDDSVFSAVEVAEKKKFEAVKKGEVRDAVLANLGAPSFELVLDSARMKYQGIDRAGKRVELDIGKGLPDSAPAELRLLPRKAVYPTLLIYSAGTVFGYIGLGDNDVVAFVEVVVS